LAFRTVALGAALDEPIKGLIGADIVGASSTPVARALADEN